MCMTLDFRTIVGHVTFNQRSLGQNQALVCILIRVYVSTIWKGFQTFLQNTTQKQV